jgi:hypothetical protein
VNEGGWFESWGGAVDGVSIVDSMDCMSLNCWDRWISVDVFMVNKEEATDSLEIVVSRGGSLSFLRLCDRFGGLLGLASTAGFSTCGTSTILGASGFNGAGVRTGFCLGPLGPRFKGLSGA